VSTTRCVECTTAAKVKRDKPEAKKKRKEYEQSATGKARNKRANKSEKGRARTKRFKKSPKGKAQMKRTNRSTAFKESKKKYIKKLKTDPGRWAFEILQTKVRKMAAGLVDSSSTVLRVIGVDAKTLRRHLETTWPDDGSMSWKNYGYGVGKWNIGHRIAKAMYNASCDEDVAHCWSLRNLFAQDHEQNRELGVKLPQYRELLQLKELWPWSWNGSLPTPEQISMYERNAQSNGINQIPSGRMSPSLALYPQ